MNSILALNAGSSSFKFALYEATPRRLGALRLRGEFAGIGSTLGFKAHDAEGRPLMAGPEVQTIDSNCHASVLRALLVWMRDRVPDAQHLIAVGHRIVHGGEFYGGAVRIDGEVLENITGLVPLARLHQPFGIAAVHALREHDPTLLQVACFDTAFHRTLPEVARRYALPRALTASGIRRYGFHGLSYDYLAGELARLLDDFPRARVIAAHLGSGSSLCAMQGGRSVATTMGFTPLDGLVMGTRPGSIDPGILLYLLQERGMSVEALSHMLNRECGLLGISGTTADMKQLLDSPDEEAQDAIESYIHSIAKEIGALATCLGGLDALAFTAGIGERAAPIRARIAQRLECFGMRIDANANAMHAQRIDASDSHIRVYVIPTDEELVIARQTHRIAASSPE